MVDADEGSLTPSPDHPLKEYPLSGVADMAVRIPCEKLPSPATEPPDPARRLSE